MGVAAPARVPIYFPLSVNLASTTEHVQVLGPETSGEVEYALLIGPDNAVYVTVASDHSDRSVERFGIQFSKQLYPDVWRWTSGPMRRCSRTGMHWCCEPGPSSASSGFSTRRPG